MRQKIVLVLMALLCLAVLLERGSWVGSSKVPKELPGIAEIEAAYRRQHSDIWVHGSGVVERILPDDNRGDRHQRLVLRLNQELTVLVAHNIDLAPRLDQVRVGDRLVFFGEYEWNRQGGAIHWTHHDPSGRREGGWLEHGGRRYR